MVKFDPETGKMILDSAEKGVACPTDPQDALQCDSCQ